MVLKATDDAKVQHLVEREFSSQTVGNKLVCFRVKGTTTNFVLTVLKTTQKGSSYIVETIGSTLEFELNNNEVICMGNTILTDANIKAEVVEEQPAKKSILRRLFK